MTEDEWLASAEPGTMLSFVRGRSSVRKLRLFAVACCRKIWGIYRGKLSCRGVVLAERLADGLPVEEDLPRFLDDLHYEGFKEIDGHRQEKENRIRWHLVLASYNSLQAFDEFSTIEQRPILIDLIPELPSPQLQQNPFSLDELIAQSGALMQRFAFRTVRRADLTRTWEATAWAVSHWHRKNDRVEARQEDFWQEAKEQVPLVLDIFGCPFPSHRDSSRLAHFHRSYSRYWHLLRESL